MSSSTRRKEKSKGTLGLALIEFVFNAEGMLSAPRPQLLTLGRRAVVWRATGAEGRGGETFIQGQTGAEVQTAAAQQQVQQRTK